MTQPNHREAQLGHDRSHYAWTPAEAAQFFADYREELLETIECCLVCRAISSADDVLDGLELVLSKLRGTPPTKETP